MPKVAKELSALEVRNLTKPGYHFVGGVSGLVLQVTESGAKTWILRASVGGKRRDIGLGGFPSVTLSGARESARAARLKIREGVDPVAERLAARSALAAARASSITFGDAAGRFIAANAAGWRNAKHAAQWASTLEKYAFPVIGKVFVSQIDTSHIMNILEPLWTEKTETANRVRGRIEAVLDWAAARRFRHGENPARWKGHLSAMLPAAGKVKRVRHHPALDYRQVGGFIHELRRVDGVGARAVEFAVLTACRSGEVRGARWSEVDYAAKVWVVPADRMKGGREQRVPLSQAAFELLAALPRLEGTDLIFPNSRGGPLSDMTLTAVIRRMHRRAADAGGHGWVDKDGEIITVHGFRSTFRDWAGETTAHSRETIEHALAHRIPDKAEASYARGTLFEKRRRLMADWAVYCSSSHGAHVGEVIPIRQS
jgi:integrase